MLRLITLLSSKREIMLPAAARHDNFLQIKSLLPRHIILHPWEQNQLSYNGLSQREQLRRRVTGPSFVNTEITAATALFVIALQSPFIRLNFSSLCSCHKKLITVQFSSRCNMCSELLTSDWGELKIQRNFRIHHRVPKWNHRSFAPATGLHSCLSKVQIMSADWIWSLVTTLLI